MSVMEINGFNKVCIMNKLNINNKACMRMKLIVGFIFSACILSLTDMLNSKFNSKKGNKAYPRALLLGVLLFCFDKNLQNLSDFKEECENNRILRMFTCGKTPSESTLKRFLTESDPDIIRKIFLYSLVLLNDLDELDTAKLFIDSTDAIVNGSIHYKVNKRSIRLFRMLKRMKLLHNNRMQSKEKTRKGLIKLKMNNSDNKDLVEDIDYILNHLNLFNKNVYKKIDDLEYFLDKSGQKYVSIMFPESVMTKTKKGDFRYCLNLQEIMTNNDIIYFGWLIEKPNDHSVLEILLDEVEKSLKFLVELQEEFGERRNYKTLMNSLKNALIICDSGYFSNDNFEYLDKHGYKPIIMSKQIARQRNNKKRAKEGIPELNQNKKDPDKISKKDFTRGHKCYICPNNVKLPLTNVKEINSKFNRRKGLSDNCKEYQYEYTCPMHNECPYKDISCSHYIIKERETGIKNDQNNLLTQDRYIEIYNERYHHESINGYIKNTRQTFHLIASNFKAAQNEIQIRNLMYNLIRMINLEGTPY